MRSRACLCAATAVGFVFVSPALAATDTADTSALPGAMVLTPYQKVDLVPTPGAASLLCIGAAASFWRPRRAAAQQAPSFDSNE